MKNIKKLFLCLLVSNFNLLITKITTPIVWSILICTLEERQELFNTLHNKLREQIKKLGLKDKIEILYYKDKRGEHTVGFKRNRLLEQSQGKYVSFIDDDDDVHDDFIQLIYDKLQSNPDCVSLTGIITFNGNNPRKFIHSIRYTNYFEQGNIYFRPPNHLNPIKRCIAIQFSFPEKNFGEDTDWALAIAQSQLLQKEEVIDIPYYFYLYQDK
ncbi:MAG: glycosyltransferase [Candidatus Babeliaceae bacterium]